MTQTTFSLRALERLPPPPGASAIAPSMASSACSSSQRFRYSAAVQALGLDSHLLRTISVMASRTSVRCDLPVLATLSPPAGTISVQSRPLLINTQN